MTDLEITRLCAKAMSIPVREDATFVCGLSLLSGYAYNPLHDDAQAMALVKKFQMLVRWDGGVHGWTAGVWYEGSKGKAIWMDWTDQDLNRAICECVAKMQEGK